MSDEYLRARRIVEEVLEEMVSDHLFNHGLDPLDAITYLSRASQDESVQPFLDLLDMIPVEYTGESAAEMLDPDRLVGIELASFRESGVDDQGIIRGTKIALTALTMLSIQVFLSIDHLQRG